jgi:RHS repeat-associated protein
MSVPIVTSPGRSGFGPQLSLSYDSGSGNGPFGFGWSLSIPAITRKTDKGLPRYLDVEEPDVFILSGAEDLVPVLREDGTRWSQTRTVDNVEYVIHRYRPRIEGLFARIERWTNQNDAKETFWRSIGKDNITTWYGKTGESRILDPNQPSHIFSWLICQSYDDKGNAIIYEYQREDSQRIFENQEGQVIALAHEQNRNDTTRPANRYIKRIKYGNRKPNRDSDTWQAVDPIHLPNETWMFEVVFDYEEGHYQQLDLVSTQPEDEQHSFVLASATGKIPWRNRQDPFSTYRAGFEVRTYRLCRRTLMFHHFPEELGIDDYLVRSTEFSYAEGPIASFITSVTQSGYLHQPTPSQPNRYLKKSLPPVEFKYSRVPCAEQLARQPIQEVNAESLENLPAGLDGTNYQWVDLDGEGTNGILTEQGTGWYYKRNLSANNIVREDGKERTVACLGPVELVTKKPAPELAGEAQFLDLAGDGQVDLAQMQGSVRGFYERTEGASWEPFQPFLSWPDLNTRDANLRFVDLTGDGHADILITEGDVLTWYPSFAEAGFGSAIRIRLPVDEEKGPRLVFADTEQSVYLADLSGDGLSDLVRIRNGEVCYWPNLGYGHFGAKVRMDNAPRFDSNDQFDQRRIRLVDTDGSGTTDIIYLRRDGVQIYFNQSGNHWSDVVPLPQFPLVDDISSVQALDLLGNGTACLVWSSPLPGAVRRPMRYLALIDEKPHLLIETRNNLGAETKVHYAPSTRFYLEDKQAGKPWITRLPFVVHVIDRVETYDHISRNRFVSRYTYHHGYFDGVEREFRGFGMVEQQDTEEYASLVESNTFPTGNNIDAASHVPPILTKTWFHTGAFIDRDHISDFFAGLLDANDQGEYYREPGLDDAQAKALLLPDSVFPDILPDRLTVDEEREACRALKGAMLRQEVYALDPTDKVNHPYLVTEQNFAIKRLQPRGDNTSAVFFTHAREAISYHYERNPVDPRIQHALTLSVNDFGHVLKEAAIGYGRRKHIRILKANEEWIEIPNPGLNELDPADQEQQTRTLITFTENRVTNSIDTTDDYRAPLPAETRTYEFTGITPESNAQRFSFEEWADHDFALPKTLTEIPYDQTADRLTPQKRLIEHVRSLYRKDDLTALLARGELEPLALPGESYKLAFTPGLLAHIFQRPLDRAQQQGAPPPENLLPDLAFVLPIQEGKNASDRGGYVDLEDNHHWWIPSGRVFFSSDTEDSAARELAFAREHFFLPHRYRDPFHTEAIKTETIVKFDGHVLLIHETQDALENTVIAENDYRVLAPYLMTDPNGNRSAVAFDALGMVAGTALMGKVNEPDGRPKGDSLKDFSPNLTTAEVNAFIAQPRQPSANPEESEVTDIVHDLLIDATTRIVYDLDRFWRLGEPPFAATIARETHLHDLKNGAQSKLQVSLSYSDGFGREIQKKIQAEPGEVPQRDAEGKIILGENGQPLMTPEKVSPRWVGSGWTLFNNKGKPVRQYEPFFTDRHSFEFDVRIGVSPVLFYDPLERIVATLHPNHTYEKVIFDPWQQTTLDVNDTLHAPQNTDQPPFDPKDDPHVGGYFERLPQREYLPTWYDLRTDDTKAKRLWPDADEADRPLPDNANRRVAEKSAAIKAVVHADTPMIAYFDTLGRPFLTVAHNKVVCKDHDLDGTEAKFHTRTELDIEGNQRKVIDAQDRIVMRYDYDMLGNRIHQASMEAGERWMLNDVTGKPIRAWDSRAHEFRTAYDQLRRSTESYLIEKLVSKKIGHTVYGETLSNPEANNLRGKAINLYDQAGVVTSDSYDFRGNLLRSQRQFARSVTVQGSQVEAYKITVNWSNSVDVNLETETFTSSTEYDALNRPIAATAPDGSVYRPTYNEANLLNHVNVNLRGATAVTPFVTNIDYDAKGQRKKIAYANGATTEYDYDPFTFRLIHLTTTRSAGGKGLASQLFTNPAVLQDLHYTYDPVGNITSIRDDALSIVQHNGQDIDPSADYIYDAIYRLIFAHGREHIGQTAFDFKPRDGNYRDYPYMGHRASSKDSKALRNYRDFYVYDSTGNFGILRHSANGGSWTQSYSYEENSLIEYAKNSNRLTRTTIGNGMTHVAEYVHDSHGNITAMPHLPVMEWDFKDQLHATQQQEIANGNAGEKTYYVYDTSGQRVRKVTERQNGKPKNERIYLGGFEIYREYNGATGKTELERETLHITDDKQRIALVETRTQGSDPGPGQLIRFQLGNHLGSAVLELDDVSDVISYEEYHPYGSNSFQAVNKEVKAAAKRYRYTGKERDEESGLYYFGARYYAAWLGRWASSDPKGLIDGLDLYAYAQANPISLRDKRGFQTEEAETRPIDVDIRKLASEHPTIVSKLLREVAFSRSLEEINRPALNKKGEALKDEKGNMVPYYEPYRGIKLEHSGETSVVPYHCTDYVFNLSFKAGLAPPTSGSKQFWMPTTSVVSQAKKLEKAGIIEIVPTPKDDPKTTVDESTQQIRPGDILVWGAREGHYGHHMLITGIDQKRKSTVSTREAGAEVLPEGPEGGREIFRGGGIPSMVYRLKKFDVERLVDLYENDSDFRQAFNTMFNKQEEQHKSFNKAVEDLSTRYGPMLPKLTDLSAYRKQQPETRK